MFCSFEISLHLTFYSNNNKVFNKTDNKSELLYPTIYYLNISTINVLENHIHFFLGNVNFHKDYAVFITQIAMRQLRKISCQIVTKTPTLR